MISRDVRAIIETFTTLTHVQKAQLYESHVRILVECIYDLDRQLKQYMGDYSDLRKVEVFKGALEDIRDILFATQILPNMDIDENATDENATVVYEESEPEIIEQEAEAALSETEVEFVNSKGNVLKKLISESNSSCCNLNCDYLCFSKDEKDGHEKFACIRYADKEILNYDNNDIFRCEKCWKEDVKLMPIIEQQKLTLKRAAAASVYSSSKSTIKSNSARPEALSSPAKKEIVAPKKQERPNRPLLKANASKKAKVK